jgi:SanA protein
MARRKRRHHHRESSGGGRVLITALVSLVALAVGAMVAAWWWLDSASEPFAADRTETAQSAEVALVLGAAPFLDDGRPNRFFEHRLDAAANLHRAGKVKFLLVSGDSVHPSYDETTAMKRGLVKRGVPAEAVYRDPAGVRTLDSVLRARDLYGLRRMVIVSQDFHVRRAVWLARQHGVEAYGLDAQGVSPFDALDSWARQFPSALKAVLDIWTGSVARYRGKPVRIGVDPAD